MLIAIVCAIAAGGSFAGGGVLQQHVASTRPEDEQLSFRLLADLARQPLWLLGIGLAFLSYVLESLALAFGPLVMVQPLVVTELLFALPISVRWHGMRMGPREWAGALAVACGLGVGLASAAPRAGRPFPPILSWGLALAVVAVLATTAVAVGRRSAGPLRSSLFALAAGLVLATQAALLKATIALFRQGFVAALGSWQLWAMVLASFIGLLLVQSAYQAGPLAASMPVVDAINPTAAIGLGLVLFDEHVRTGVWLAGVVAGLVLLFGGIVALDTSPLVQRLQLVERNGRVSRRAQSMQERRRRWKARRDEPFSRR